MTGKDGQRASDLLRRDFTAPALNRRWVADFTLRGDLVRGRLRIAFVVDIDCRAIVGWSGGHA